MRLFKYCLILLNTLILSAPAFAQNDGKTIDSLFFLASSTTDFKAAVNIADKAFLLAKKNNDKPRMGKCLLIKLIKNCDGAKYQEALNLFPETERLAQENKNYSFLAQLYTIKANIYSTLGFFDESRSVLYKARLFANKIGESEIKHYRLGMLYNALAVNYEQSNVLSDSVHYYNKLAYNEGRYILKDEGLRTIKSLWADNLGLSFLKLKEIDSAEYYLNEALKAGRLDRDTIILGMVYKNFGDLSVFKKNNPVALQYYKESLLCALAVNNAYNKKDAYLGLATAYKNSGEVSLSADFYHKYQILADSLNKVEKLLMKTPLKSIAEEITEVKEEKKYNQIIVTVIIALAIALAISIVAYRNYKLHKIESLRRKLDKKEFVSSLEEMKKQVNTDTLGSLLKLAQSKDPSYFIKFYEAYPDFKGKLLQKAPMLSINDLELCTYIRMNFDNKEIARYTNTTVKSVESRKYRIKKKLGLNQDVNLNLWMTDF